MADLKKFVEDIKSLSVVELNDLVKMIEEEFGVSAAAVAVAGPVAGAAAVAEEPSTLTVHMTAIDATQKIPTIKAIREITGLGLGEAKALCDNAPSVIKENIPAEEAKEIAEKLKAVGATIELK
jgi:large subunit ribosomal protein L7/L12